MKHDPLAAFLGLIADAPQRLVADASPQALQAHVDDALGSLPLLASESGPLIDVGSGAGLPGIPILLERPDLTGALLDSRARRCQHLAAAVAATGLDDRVTVLNLRAEVHGHSSGRGHYGIVVARALAAAQVAMELCIPLARVGGVVLLHAGAVSAAELRTAAGALGAELEQIEPVPGFDNRHRITFRKLSPSAPSYPRRAGAIARDPLVPQPD